MEQIKKLKISEWPEADRPREKMMQRGPQALTDAELLAILIGSGNNNESAVELMRRILTECGNNLNKLGKWGVNEFSRYKGIGDAKAITIMAALELGKRRNREEAVERETIVTSKDIFNIFHPIMCDLPQEEFWIMLTNQASKLIGTVRISTGGIDGTYADIRTILREALLKNATGIILCHNHPSGNPLPSESDRRLTNAIRQGAKTMNIHLWDHVIVCDGNYYSFADKGEIL